MQIFCYESIKKMKTKLAGMNRKVGLVSENVNKYRTSQFSPESSKYIGVVK